MAHQHYDRWLVLTKNKRPKEHPPVWLLAAILIGWFLASVYAGRTDLEDAANIAAEEEEAHQQHVDTWLRFKATATPFRASDLGVIATACQQTADRKWECFAK